MTDFGGKKCVVGVDGEAVAVDLTEEELAQQTLDATTSAEIRAANKLARERIIAISQSPRVADLALKLRSATEAQIDTYVDNNSATLAQARQLLKDIIKILAVSLRV